MAFSLGKSEGRLTRSVRILTRGKSDKALLNKQIQRILGHVMGDNYDGYLNFRELNKEVREAKARKEAFSERLWMGVFGGVAVIAPMLLMSLHRDLSTSLITSSVATMLFALVLALAAKSLKGQEILGATAAYAAVLVVFVGTSMAPIP